MYFNLADLERSLMRQIGSACHDERLRMLRSGDFELERGRFCNWLEVRHWLDDVGIWHERADPILRPMLEAYQQSYDQAWSEILLYLFWRPLARVYWLVATQDSDPATRHSQVFWAFTKALQRIDVDRRGERLGAKVIQDTRHDVREFYERERARGRRCKYLEDMLSGEENHRSGWEVPSHDVGFASFEYRHDSAWAIGRLKSRVRAGQLTRTDFLILVGCHLYGRTLDEMAARQGLNYESAKKRRQRAVSLLKKTAPELSPDLPDTPLMSMSRSSRKEKSHVRKL